MTTRPVTRALTDLGGTAGSIASTAERGFDRALDATALVAEDLQERAVDLTLDVVTLKPLQAALEAVGLLGKTVGDGSQIQPELEYLEEVNDAGPYTSSLVPVVLTTQYANLNKHEEGITRFQGYLKRFSGLSSFQRAVYLACLALLRAGRVQQTPLWKLGTVVGQITQLLGELKEAKELTKSAADLAFPPPGSNQPSNEKLIVRWISGLLNAQLPRPFGNRDTAFADLKWVEETVNSDVERKASAFQFLRETYFNLALLFRERGEQEEAEKYLRLSTFSDFQRREIVLATPYSASGSGLREGIRRVEEPVRATHPGKVFTVSGFDISEFNFVITADERELLAIDAGSRPDTAMAAYRFLQNYYTENYGKELPELRRFFATHNHWDHVGGHRTFLELNSDLQLYSRFGFETVRARSANQPPPFDWYLGDRFVPENVSTYQPTFVVGKDEAIGRGTEFDVGGLSHRVFETDFGGSRVQLILPYGGGGETEDGMMIYFPEYRVLHVGDFMVPWIGTPFLIEGDFEALIGSLDLIDSLEPRPTHLLHGHEPLTLFFGDVDTALQFKPQLDWLYRATLKAIYEYNDLPTIQEMNLFNRDILNPSLGQVQLPYLIFREVVIDRLFRQKVGYWGPQLQGVDYLSEKEIGAFLSKYLNQSPSALAIGINHMIDNGDHELAGRTVNWALTQYPDSEVLKKSKRRAFLKLKEKWQNINPFKFVMYSETINNPTKQIQ